MGNDFFDMPLWYKILALPACFIISYLIAKAILM